MTRTRCGPRWHRPIEAIGAAVIAASLIAVPGLAGAGTSAAAAAVNAPSGTAPGGPGTTRTWTWRAKTLRHRAEHHLEGVVHGGRRRAVRCVLPDDESSNVKTPAVPRHRREAFADLQERDMTYTVSSPIAAAWYAR